MNDIGRSVAPAADHRVLDVETPQGVARVFVVDETTDRHGTLILGHGAGKGTNTPDLHRLLNLAHDGWRVMLVDQPWVLAGRKLATRPVTLDEAWIAVLEHLRAAGELSKPLVVGGRSAGARVACRTAERLGAELVLALAFPLIPPGKKDLPEKWRTGEAQGVLDSGIQLAVVQGRTDAFGGPEVVATALPQARIESVAGAHSFTPQPDDVLEAARSVLRELQ